MASTCKACGAPIYWVTTEKGKYMCCDEGLIPYQRDPNGKDNIVLQNGQVIRVKLNFTGTPDGLGRTPHWATCPQADKFRRR